MYVDLSDASHGMFCFSLYKSLSSNSQQDKRYCAIRKVDLLDSSVTRLAGDGNCVTNDADGLSASFSYPSALALTNDSSILFVGVSK